VARSVGVNADMSDCAIPTKPAGGLLSDFGKVAPTHGRVGAPYQTALKWFNVPPWAHTMHPLTGSSTGRYLHCIEPTPRGCKKGPEDDVKFVGC